MSLGELEFFKARMEQELEMARQAATIEAAAAHIVLARAYERRLDREDGDASAEMTQ